MYEFSVKSYTVFISSSIICIPDGSGT